MGKNRFQANPKIQNSFENVFRSFLYLKTGMVSNTGVYARTENAAGIESTWNIIATVPNIIAQ